MGIHVAALVDAHVKDERHHYYRQDSAPVSVEAGGSDPLQLGDIWSDTTSNLIKRCDGIDADSFTSIEGSSGTATQTSEGIVELGTTVEIDAGADTSRVMAIEDFNDADWGAKTLQATVVNYTTDVATGDGKFYFVVPAELAGWNLVAIRAEVITAGTTNNLDMTLVNTSQSDAEILSTAMRIETGETSTDTSAQPGVIDTGQDDMTLGDVISLNVDAVQTTKPKGLIVTFTFRITIP